MKIERENKIVEVDLNVGDLVLITDEKYLDYLNVVEVVKLDLEDSEWPIQVELEDFSKCWIHANDFLTLKEAIEQGYDTFTIEGSLDTDFKEDSVIAKVEGFDDCRVVGRFYNVKKNKFVCGFNCNPNFLNEYIDTDIKVGNLVLITDENCNNYLAVSRIIDIDLEDNAYPIKVENEVYTDWIRKYNFLTLKEAIEQGYDTFTLKDYSDIDIIEDKVIVKVEEFEKNCVVGKLYNIDENKFVGDFKCSPNVLNKYVDINVDDKASEKDTLKVVTNKIDSKIKENVVKIANNLIDLYVRKNDDYGDSFNRGREIFGEIGGEVRISDKLFRFQALYKNEDKAKVNESLTDTVLDLVNYTSMHRVKDLNKVESLGEIYNNIIEILLNPSFVLSNLKNNSVNLGKILDDKLIEGLTEFINDIVGR